MHSTPQPAIDALTAALSPVEQSDTISAAGRKLILADTIRLIALEDGARISDDPEFIHDMRVATRRMRSVLRLLSPYYSTKQVRRLIKRLRWLARKLGMVRDLDVLLLDLSMRAEPALSGIVERVQHKRGKAHKKLAAALDSSDYAALIDKLTAFALETADPLADTPPLPVEVRHVVPVLLHQRLAAVRGFDTLLENGAQPGFDTLHALRIEFKQLRYATAAFKDVLGGTADAFVGEIKAIQDHLGRLNDVVVFEARLRKLVNDALIDPALMAILEALQHEADRLEKDFSHVWMRFNSRAVQKNLADALLVLR